MRIRPAYVKCDAVSGSGKTVHHQVGPQGRDGSLYVDVFLKQVGKNVYEQTEHPRVSITDRPITPGSDIRLLVVEIDGKEIYHEERLAY